MNTEEDLTLRMRAKGGRAAAKEIIRTRQAVTGVTKATYDQEKAARRASTSMKVLNGTMRSTMSVVSRGAGGALGLYAVGGAITYVVRQASDLNETVTKTRQIFGASAPEMMKWGDAAAEAIGMSKRQALDAASTFALFFQNMGATDKQAAALSRRYVGLSADMASFFNVSNDEANTALAAGLRGESEPLARFGVDVRETTLQQLAKEKGLWDGIGSTMPRAIRLQAMNLQLQKQTAKAQGDYQRTLATSLPNQLKRTRALMDNLAASAGKALLPALLSGVRGLNDFVVGWQQGTGAGGDFKNALVDVKDAAVELYQWVDRNQAVLLVLAGSATSAYLAFRAFLIIQRIVAFVRLAVAVFRLWRAGLITTRSAMIGLNIAMVANPIGLIVAGIAALVAALVIAYLKVDWFHNAVDDVWSWIKDHWPLLASILGGPFVAAAIQVYRNWDGIKDFFSGIADHIWTVFSAVFDWLKGAWNDVAGTLNDGLGAGSWLTKKLGLGDLGEIPTFDTSSSENPIRGGATASPSAGTAPAEPLVLAPAGGAPSPSVFSGDVVAPITLNLDGKPAAKAVHRAALKKKATK